MKRVSVLVAVLAACGGGEGNPGGDAGLPPPGSDGMMANVDAGIPDAAMLTSPIALRVVTPVDVIYPASGTYVHVGGLSVTLSGTVQGEGITLKVNNVVAEVTNLSWQATVDLPASACTGSKTPPFVVNVSATNYVPETIVIPVTILYDACPPSITWTSATVHDERGYKVGYGGADLLPCLYEAGSGQPTTTLDGSTPGVVYKYQTNLTAEGGNPTFKIAPIDTTTGCMLATPPGGAGAQAGANPIRLAWNIRDDADRPMKVQLLVRQPGGSEFVEAVSVENVDLDGDPLLARVELPLTGESNTDFTRRADSTYTVRAIVTDGNTQTAQSSDYDVRVVVLPGPIGYSLAAAASNQVPSGILGGSTAWATTVGNGDRRLGVRTITFRNRTPEHITLGVASSEIHTYGGYDAKRAIGYQGGWSASCPGAVSPPSWSGTLSTTYGTEGGGGRAQNAFFALSYGASQAQCLTGSDGNCSQFRIAPYGSANVTVIIDGLGNSWSVAGTGPYSFVDGVWATSVSGAGMRVYAASLANGSAGNCSTRYDMDPTGIECWTNYLGTCPFPGCQKCVQAYPTCIGSFYDPEAPAENVPGACGKANGFDYWFWTTLWAMVSHGWHVNGAVAVTASPYLPAQVTSYTAIPLVNSLDVQYTEDDL